MEMVIGGKRTSAKSTHKIPAWIGEMDTKYQPWLRTYELLGIGESVFFTGVVSDREITIQELPTQPIAYGQRKVDTVGFTVQSWFCGEAGVSLGGTGRRGRIWWRHVERKPQRREIMQSFNVKKIRLVTWLSCSRSRFGGGGEYDQNILYEVIK